ncbi:MAG: hypothetical protein Q8Q88_23950 [Phenylobacterium sp.]|uniref:hypothetical protein n=1 Tax=Phenylobacterium sp. TaxID=1871053 RepID=UPI00273351A9|nr:hypothetical protein [Phenylobacterium sp.]MDP3750090.1 hypothetical protein [Phenylobacterium sp.]
MNFDQVGLAVAGGICGACLTQAATFLRDWLVKGEEGRFTALTLALALEDFASRCTQPVFALENYASSNFRTAEPSGSIPKLPEYPDRTSWRSIGVEHASNVLSFRVMVDSAHSYLSDVWEHEGSASVWGNASDKAVELGAAALEVAGKLRRAFTLPAMPKGDSFDAEVFFRDRLADLATRRTAYEKAGAEMWAELDAEVALTEPSE